MHSKVLRLITDLHRENHIDDMTRKWLSQTPNPPRIPEFYTLTKIHKPTITGRPIISGCDGPTERISSFVDTLLQPISKIQKSYLKDTTDFINFIENTKVKKRTFLVSMDVTSLYTNIPQNEGIEIVCKAYKIFNKDNPPIPTHYPREMLKPGFHMIVRIVPIVPVVSKNVQTIGTIIWKHYPDDRKRPGRLRRPRSLG